MGEATQNPRRLTLSAHFKRGWKQISQSNTSSPTCLQIWKPTSPLRPWSQIANRWFVRCGYGFCQRTNTYAIAFCPQVPQTSHLNFLPWRNKRTIKKMPQHISQEKQQKWSGTTHRTKSMTWWLAEQDAAINLPLGLNAILSMDSELGA